MIIIDPKEFGLKILMERKRREWTQSEAANEVGISKQAISLLERGQSIPSKTTLKKLKDVFPVIWN